MRYAHEYYERRPGASRVDGGLNFPGDLPIGVVTKVDLNELDTSQLVHIKPYADFHQLDIVQVITKPFTRSAGPKP